MTFGAIKRGGGSRGGRGKREVSSSGGGGTNTVGSMMISTIKRWTGTKRERGRKRQRYLHS